MAQVRTTRYLCDACGAEQKRKRDLVRFLVRGRSYSDTVEFDLCDTCEGKFLTTLSEYVVEEQNVGILRRAHADR